MPVPNPAPLDVVRLSVVWKANSQAFITAYDYKVSSVLGGGLTMQQISDQWLILVQTNWPAFMAAATLLEGVKAEYIDLLTSRVLQSRKTLDGVTAGTIPGDNAPTQVALVITRSTGFARPAFRGRIYWGPVAIDKVAADAGPDSAWQTALVNNLNTFFINPALTEGIQQTQLTAQLYHRPPHKLPQPYLSQTILSYDTTDKFGTQKKRGEYGKFNQPI